MSDQDGGFDPRRHVRQLRGRGGASGDYLDVKWRLVWLRNEAPDSLVRTELVELRDGFALFKATVTRVVDGESRGEATGFGSETANDFGDYIEKAETKAIGRALNAMGYGAESMDEDERPINAPAERAPAPANGNGNGGPPRQASQDPNAVAGPNGILRRDVNRIWAVVGELPVEKQRQRDEYRRLLGEMFGLEHTTDLRPDQVGPLVAELQRLGHRLADAQAAGEEPAANPPAAAGARRRG